MVQRSSIGTFWKIQRCILDVVSNGVIAFTDLSRSLTRGASASKLFRSPGERNLKQCRVRNPSLRREMPSRMRTHTSRKGLPLLRSILLVLLRDPLGQSGSFADAHVRGPLSKLDKTMEQTKVTMTLSYFSGMGDTLLRGLHD
jgi:hypothetical protein